MELSHIVDMYYYEIVRALHLRTYISPKCMYPYNVFDALVGIDRLFILELSVG